MTGCPAEQDLVRLFERALGDDSIAALEAHVAACDACAGVVAELGALDRAADMRQIGRYVLDRRLATGGMGEVWAAWDPQLRRELAVKLVRPDRADRTRERERLLREARALARLGHPNVLAIHDFGEVGGEVFIATELVAGDTLEHRGGVTADWRELARYYVQAARGLAAAHAAGLVHRDVKPANLLLGADGRVRVADFGLAVRARADQPPTGDTQQDGAPVDALPASGSITAVGHVVGTPAYMSPEQRLGAPVDARADQYALCIALAESIGGDRPSGDPDAPNLIAFFLERRPREPDLVALATVLARGLEPDPDHRYPHANALADAIEAIVHARSSDPSFDARSTDRGVAPAATPSGRRVAQPSTSTTDAAEWSASDEPRVRRSSGERSAIRSESGARVAVAERAARRSGESSVAFETEGDPPTVGPRPRRASRRTVLAIAAVASAVGFGGVVVMRWGTEPEASLTFGQAWCSMVLPEARKAAAARPDTAHKRTEAEILRRLAACSEDAGRCDQARALWQRSLELDATRSPAVPGLGDRCR